ncbi:protein kinase, putative [Trypanosoma brucei gambiense DAL972]|uniref:non-specific serine/threonine protein kinase n=3 Tax=Trypanosoma brucei TaxID=5691 RepID=Q57ZK4_TRYB2|nr:protein kinase, putative [Trypanosoma brucei gambiense DAL972]XP_843901.1 serine/threonine-protein kinase NEK1, putative [Trypanosoma brucei brucei TREU927]AAX79478.1 serine/threonine-protein kinase NEK1, putative [Trypanosoma brucei]RHW73374.1 serine/threonine-protein kinase Nek [Trypanosoma brucei equiperdum]AAZ10342.1 serine/threonine-protein kinase NEK1, putative [Trypanosoma brucei brucei TREU927]CBH09984.1 protein kinase, putative [Trypanosoma brucei gambiense DAL972]|eukprot:XP_011772275.1 protein kinase, putative [Trypanosoma brucei gambiense DAL972]
MKPRDISAPELKRYAIEKALFLGNTTDVFKVREVGTDRPYVLKQMSLLPMGADERKRVLQEICVMSGVDHPNIVKFRESFSGNTSVNIIMECCKCTLEEIIMLQQEEGQPFPEEAIIEWMVELLSGLAHLHSRRVVHRDIKTSNIFVTEKNHLKLGDFGVCTVLTSASIATNSMVGTPLYFSPEVCAGDAYDVRSDVWSLGVVFYEMCTLRRPFEAEHLPGLLQQVLTRDVAPFDTGLDTRLEEIVLRMLRKDPKERPTSQDLIDNHLVVPPSHPSHASQKPSRGRLIQQYYGPELFFSCDAVTSWGNERGAEEKAAVMAVDDCSRKKLQVRQQQKHPLTARGQTGAPKVPGNTAVPAKRNNIPKKATPRLDKGKELSSQERMEAMERIKSAKSKINMSELRKNMQQRRMELLGKENADAADGVPVVIELKQEPRSSQRADTSDISLSHEDLSRTGSSFLDDIAAVLERHSAGGAKIDLDQLDDAAALLCQYKVTNYGLC